MKNLKVGDWVVAVKSHHSFSMISLIEGDLYLIKSISDAGYPPLSESYSVGINNGLTYQNDFFVKATEDQIATKLRNVYDKLEELAESDLETAHNIWYCNNYHLSLSLLRK